MSAEAPSITAAGSTSPLRLDPVHDWPGYVSQVQAAGDEAVVISLERDGSVRSIRACPGTDEAARATVQSMALDLRWVLMRNDDVGFGEKRFLLPDGDWDEEAIREAAMVAFPELRDPPAEEVLEHEDAFRERLRKADEAAALEDEELYYARIQTEDAAERARLSKLTGREGWKARVLYQVKSIWTEIDELLERWMADPIQMAGFKEMEQAERGQFNIAFKARGASKNAIKELWAAVRQQGNEKRRKRMSSPSSPAPSASAEPGAAPMEFICDDSGRPRASAPINIEIAVSRLGKMVQYDEFTGSVFLDGKEVVDDDLGTLRVRVAEGFNFLPSKELFLDKLIEIAKRNSFHQVRRYLDSLTWDRVPRIDTWLPDYMKVKDTPLSRMAGRKFLIAAVRRVRQPGCFAKFMLIIQGKQGVGKSPLLRALCPRPEFFHDEAPVGGETKQLMEIVNGKWILECGELRGLRGKGLDAVKANISRLVDRSRLAYGRLTAERPRQFILAGSVNDIRYLTDETGNDRFWCFQIPHDVVQTGWREIESIRDQIWAEASVAEATGEEIALPGDLRAEAEREAQAHRVEPRFVQDLRDHLPKEGRIRPVCLQRFLGYREARELRRGDRDDIAATMRFLGWETASTTRNGRDIFHWRKGHWRKGPGGDLPWFQATKRGGETWDFEALDDKERFEDDCG